MSNTKKVLLAAALALSLLSALVVFYMLPVWQVNYYSNQAIQNCGQGNVSWVNTGGYECKP